MNVGCRPSVVRVLLLIVLIVERLVCHVIESITPPILIGCLLCFTTLMGANIFPH